VAHSELLQDKTLKKALESTYELSRQNNLNSVLVCLSDKIPASPAGDLIPEITIEAGRMTTSPPSVVTFLKRGELLRIYWRKIGKDYVRLVFQTVNPHSVTRGVGAFQHQASETLYSIVRFSFPPAMLSSTDPAPIRAEIEKWFKSFIDYDSAVAFGNTASGQFVPEIKIGMTLEEVEKILGPPETKFTFPDRTVYRYKDFTVEFKNNLVTDIKY
jgi:hypothetical protein